MFRNIKKIEQTFEIPESIIDDVVKVTCMGRDKVVIENYIGILEYDDNYIRLNTGDGDVFVYGQNLTITEMTKDDILVLGKLHMIEFER